MEKRYIYALGYFDGVHLGHQALLDACKKAAQEQGVHSGALTFWGHPEELLLGRSPALINTTMDRNSMLRQTVEEVVELPFDFGMMRMPWRSFMRMLVQEHNACGIVCGADFRFGRGGVGNTTLLQEYCQSAGLSCTVVPEQCLDGQRISSSLIRKLLEQGDPEQAQRYLGHPHVLSGTVVHGRQVGRTIGFPTANISYPDMLVKIPYGVYATVAEVDGQQYPAVTNLGVRPTVSGRGVTVESYLIGFSGDLYGKRLKLMFLKFLREEERFADLSLLGKQIKTDTALANQIGKIYLDRMSGF